MASIEGLYLSNINITSSTKDNVEFTGDLYEKGLLLGSVAYSTANGITLVNQKLVSSIFELIIANMYNNLQTESLNHGAYLQSFFKKDQYPTLMLEEVVKHLYVLTMTEQKGIEVYDYNTIVKPYYVGAFLLCEQYQPQGSLEVERYMFSSTTKMNINKDFYEDLQSPDVVHQIKESVIALDGTPEVLAPNTSYTINGCIVLEANQPMPDLSIADYFTFLDYIELV